MEVIVAAAIPSLIAIIAARFQAKKTRKGTAALQADIATNHGMRPGEYLERIHSEVADMRSLLVIAANHSERVANELVAHTAADADNFAELMRRLPAPGRNTRGRKP